VKRTPERPREQIIEAVGTASGRRAHRTAGAKSRTILAGKHKYGFRKNWGKLEFAQDALQALYAEVLPTYTSPKVLGEVRGYLAHDPKYRATYGDYELDRMTMTRALQKLNKIRR
jgi:hypothetical protein